MTDTDTTISEMLASGRSQRSIAETLHVSRHHVRRIADTPGQTSVVHERAPRDDVSVKGLAGRVSQDRPGRGPGGWTGALIDRSLSAQAGDAIGANTLLLDVDSISRLPLNKLVDMAVSASPEMSRAHFDFLRMFASGHECKVYNVGKKTEHKNGQARADAFRDLLKYKHGDESVVYLQLASAGFIRGALIAELVMDDKGREPIDIATPDPATFSFRLIDNVWVIGQYQGAEWVPMDRPTFRHVQLDKRPGRPQGHAIAESALFPALFLLGLYQDLRRVIANQGYPRLDIAVNTEMLMALIEEKFETMIEFDDALEQLTAIIQDKVGNIGPGDAYVHADLVVMNKPIGAINTELASIKEIIVGLERMTARALKTIDLDATEGADNSNRKYEMYVEGVKSVQRPAEHLIESLFEMMLQAYGIIADVEFRFATVRAAESYRDARTRQLEITNELMLMDRGMQRPDETAMNLTGRVSDSVEAMYGKDAKTVAPPPAPEPKPEGEDEDSDADLDDTGGEGGERHTRAINMLPSVPPIVPINDADLISAANRFDDIVAAEFAGMMDATVRS